MARRGRNKNKNDAKKDYDVMNPEEVNPTAKKAIKQLEKAVKKIVKMVAKVVKKLFLLLIKSGPVGWIILAIIIVIIIFVAFQHMPGMMQSKLLDLFKIDISDWLSNGAVAKLDDDYQDIIDVANYLEEMDYSLIGDGFVTPVLRTESSILTIGEIMDKNSNYEQRTDSEGIVHIYDKETNEIVSNLKYYDNLGKTIDNETGKAVDDKNYTDEFGIIRSLEETNEEGEKTNPRGKIAEIKKENLNNYNLIRSYLLSNYRIYTLKNSDEDMLTKIYNAFGTIGGNDNAWAKGLIKLYNAEGGIATQHWWWGKGLMGEQVSINDTTLTLKKGWFNKGIDFKIEGWAPRYGLSLSFLLSLHLGTKAPDLVTAMLQNFDTEIQVYLDDAGESSVVANYIDPNNVVEVENGNTFEGIKAALDKEGDWIASWGLNDEEEKLLTKVKNDWVLTKQNCKHLLQSDLLSLESPDNCKKVGTTYVVEASSCDTSSFLWLDSSRNSLSTYGITKNTDPEIYNLVDSYPNTTFKDGSKDVKFDLEHITKGVNVKEAKKERNRS